MNQDQGPVTKGHLSPVMTSLLSPAASWAMADRPCAQTHSSPSRDQQTRGLCRPLTEALPETKGKTIWHF